MLRQKLEMCRREPFIKGSPASFQNLPDSARYRCRVRKQRARSASGSATTLLSPLDSGSTGISKQLCELPAGVDLSQLLPIANPFHRRLSDVDDGLRIGLLSNFRMELL
jgi:hypothetical protein